MALLGTLFGVLIVAMCIMHVVGSRLPATHIATSAASFSSPASRVYTLLRNVAAYPSWRQSIREVTVLPSDDGRFIFRITGRRRTTRYIITKELENEVLVFEMAEAKAAFGGSWTHEISSVGGGALLRITETGWIKPPIIRFLARYIFGYSTSIKTTLSDLRSSLG